MNGDTFDSSTSSICWQILGTLRAYRTAIALASVALCSCTSNTGEIGKMADNQELDMLSYDVSFQGWYPEAGGTVSAHYLRNDGSWQEHGFSTVSSAPFPGTNWHSWQYSASTMPACSSVRTSPPASTHASRRVPISVCVCVAGASSSAAVASTTISSSRCRDGSVWSPDP